MNDRLAILLSVKKIKQTAFASAVGVAPSTVSQWLSGKRIPSEAVVRHICQIYGVNQAWLEDGSGEMLIASDDPKAEEITRMLYEHPIANSIINSLIQLNDRDWETVEKIVHAIKCRQPSEAAAEDIITGQGKT